MRPVFLEITVVTAQRTPIPAQTLEVSPAERVVAIVQRLLDRLGSKSWTGEWNLLHQGARLPLDGTIGALVPSQTTVVALVLCSDACDISLPLPAAPAPDDSGVDLAFEDDADEPEDAPGSETTRDVNEGVSVAEAAEVKPAAPPLPSGLPAAPTAAAAAPAAPATPATLSAGPNYQARVRYYSLMNPRRVYPLLVTLGAHAVDRHQEAGATRGARSPARADRFKDLEVEPVLPGCTCYPPREIIRAGGDATLRFHVVPQVFGDIGGASVVVRHEGQDLAAVALEMRVARRTGAAVGAALTLVLPLALLILRHADVDLDSRQAGGFNIAIEVLRLTLRIPPGVLALVLAGLTGALFWLTRPRTKEVFFEVNHQSDRPEVYPTSATRDGGADDLPRIVALKDRDAEAAAAKLLELLTAHPEYQAAWLQYAHWHFETQDHETALEGFEKALALGAARSHDYVRAALSASRLGRYRQALDMLHAAEKALPPGQVDGVVFFNMGCYHARLGQLDEVVPCLRRAVAAGCRKPESFLEDEDLAPVRQRPDFEKLVAELRDSARRRPV